MNVSSRAELIERLMLLRYGTMSPTEFSPPILPYYQIERITGHPASKVSKLLKQYAQSQISSTNDEEGDHQDSLNYFRSRPLRLKDVPQSIVEFVTSTETLRLQASMSLEERAAIARARFNLHGFKVYHLRSIFR